MKPLIGEYDCTLDAKGRLLMPAALRKQLPEEQQSDFVLNKGLGKHLVLYPLAVWEEELRKIQTRNQYMKKNRDFTRLFLQGATPIALDSNGRVLIPKRLMEYAEMEKDIILAAQIDRIEIWDKVKYENWLDDSVNDFEKLAEEVMGNDEEDAEVMG